METISNTITETVETLSNRLVSVDARRGYPLSGVVWSEDVLVTTNRAVARESDIHIGLPDGNTVTAELIGRAPNVDLAALKLSSDVLSVPEWVTTDNLKVGQLMLRLGRSSGVRVTMGVLSGLEPWRSRSGVKLDKAITTDASPFRGFSGGVLATLSGEVVGVNTAALSRGGDTVIPTANIERTVKELLEHGRVRQGYLGISGQPVRLPESLRASQEQRAGLLVMAVEPGSPAEEAGLALGDVILKLDDTKVTRANRLMAELTGKRIGEKLLLSVARGGEVQTFTVRVAERAE